MPEPRQAQGGDSQKHAVLMRLVCGCYGVALGLVS